LVPVLPGWTVHPPPLGAGEGEGFGEDPGDGFGEDPGDGFGEDLGDGFGEDPGDGFGDGFGDGLPPALAPGHHDPQPFAAFGAHAPMQQPPFQGTSGFN
jgi:hypothetical protein